MIKQTKFLQKFLATASALAVIAGGTSSASGGGRNTGGAPVNLSAVPGIALNDWLIFNGGATVTVNAGSPARIAGIDVAVNPGGNTVIANNITIGSISGVAAKAMKVDINAGNTLTLDGTAFGGIVANTYDKLGDILFNGAGSKLVIDANVTLNGTMNSRGGINTGQGDIEINAGKNVVITGAILQAKAIGSLKLGANAKLNLQAAIALTDVPGTGSGVELGNGSELTVTGGRTIHGILTTEEINGTAPDQGTLIFTGGNSTLSQIAVGNTHKIHEFRIASAHELDTDESIKATQINFTADGSLKVDRLRIEGDVDNKTANANIGTLKLNAVGSGVTGTIGATKALKVVSFDAAGAMDVTGNAKAQTFVVNNAAAVVTAGGTITGNVDFTKAGGTLNAGGGLITGAIDSTVGGANGTLNFTVNGGVTGAIGTTNPLHAINVKNGITATLSADVVKATTITIGEAGGAGTLVRGGNVDFTLNPAGVNIVFAHADSVLKLQSTGGASKTITLNTINPGAPGKGIVELHANGAGSKLVIVGGAAGQTLGTGVNKLKELRISGTGNDDTMTIIAGGANAVDLTNVNVLNIKRGAALWDQSKSAVNIAVTNIGEAGAGGAGGLVLDATEGDLALLNGGTAINFVHADSQLVLGHDHVGADRTITLHNNLVGGGDNQGIVTLWSKQAGKQLIIAKNGIETIGTSNVNRIQELIIDGPGSTAINPKVYTQNLILNDIGTTNFIGGVDQGTGGNIDVNENVTVQGNIDGVNTSINLTDKVLTYNKGTATLTGNVIVNTNLKVGGGIGQIKVDATGGATELNLSQATSVTINLNGTSDLADTGQSYSLFEATNGGVITAGFPAPTLANNDTKALAWTSSATAVLSNAIAPVPDNNVPIIVNANDGNKYVLWVEDSVTHRLTVINNSTKGLQNDFGKTNPGLVKALAGADLTSDAGNLVNDLGKAPDAALKEKIADSMSVVAPTAGVAEAVAEATTGAVQATQNVIGNRMHNLPGAANAAVRVSEGMGVAAGDEFTTERYGIWGSPFYSQSTQKKKSNAPGYKGKSGGGTIGFDCLANDNLALGMALTAISTKLDHKNQKLGDTTKVESTLFSIYGVQQLPENWFVQGIVSFGSSRVRNYEKRVISSTLSQTALGKYNSTNYSGEILGGYRYALADANTTLTPMVGFRYAKFNDGGYTETGTSRRNMTVSKKSIDKIEGVIGARASFLAQVKDVLLMPEVHGFVSQDFKGKAAKVDARLNGALAAMPTKVSKPEKTFVNLGTSLTIKYRMMEYGFGYDAHLAKKYVGHQGSIKIRVNF
ncbi:autotransporter domain-containing protein [Candidatus Trichorickettsia mobilis]|uniref:autotransporter domain-containing protein n=1 Tax=Candidatus Trichorickettsia mobilis TaxID=1346319 RepID=UPI00292EB65F|nr:autotransporter domain-containing protein [Candidatus Trichorickettsia mobilis]